MGTIVPPEQWRRCAPEFTSSVGGRDAALYARCIDQFLVESAARYQPSSGVTWCNVYVKDVMQAMTAFLPDKIGDAETTANMLCGWLNEQAAGWRMCGSDQAVQAAQQGKPTIVGWLNPEGHGHIAIVRPEGSVGPGAMIIAQAGKQNYQHANIERGFGTGRALGFWTHA